MAHKRWPAKTPDALRVYGYDWTNFLVDRGSSITVASVTYTADPPDDLGFATNSIVGNIAYITISSGCANTEYRVRMQATLSNGEIEEKSMYLKVVEHKDA